jgi:hypothetical protein
MLFFFLFRHVGLLFASGHKIPNGCLARHTPRMRYCHFEQEISAAQAGAGGFGVWGLRRPRLLGRDGEGLSAMISTEK